MGRAVSGSTPIRRCLDCGAKAKSRALACWACGSRASAYGVRGDKDCLFTRFGDLMLTLLEAEGNSRAGAWLRLSAQTEWAKLVRRASGERSDDRFVTEYRLNRLDDAGIAIRRRRTDDDECLWA